MKLGSVILLAGLGLAACGPQEPAAPSEAVVAPPIGAVLSTSPDILAADLAARARELADDKYEGRGPGTVAGEAAAQWIADEMKRMGLQPGPDGTYFQTVEMVAQTVDKATSNLSVTVGGKSIPLALGPDAVYGTKRQDQMEVSVSDSPLVFVGYGVVAPELGWNDYEGLDDDASLFNGRAMTYYGRWTYKFEEAARQGATAVLLIHETKPAAYGWDVVEGSWSGEQADLVRADAGASRAVLEGWITLERATEIFSAAGLNIDAMRAAANKRGFKAQPVPGATASAVIRQTVDRRQSRNVIGVLPGAERPDEHVLFTAHWDHLGNDKTAMPGVDAIYNGAVDNATGVSAMLEVAEALAAGDKPARSISFLAVTLEESGLLGSAYFADYPLIPLNRIVGGVNIDGINPIGRTKDMIVVGAGASELEDRLKTLLTAAGRVIRPDPTPENGYFYRSDHISLSKKGVPMLYVDGGIDALDGGEAKGIGATEAYTRITYHSPSDEFREDWDFAGMQEDAAVIAKLAFDLASSADWPQWYEGNEFRATREASLAGK